MQEGHVRAQFVKHGRGPFSEDLLATLTVLGAAVESATSFSFSSDSFLAESKFTSPTSYNAQQKTIQIIFEFLNILARHEIFMHGMVKIENNLKHPQISSISSFDVSQTHKIGNYGNNANYVFPYLQFSFSFAP